MRRRKQHNTARDRKENSTTQKKRGWKAAPPSSSSPKKKRYHQTQRHKQSQTPQAPKHKIPIKEKNNPRTNDHKSRILLIYCHSPDVFLTLTATQDVSSHSILTRTATLHKAVRMRTWREAEQTHEVCVLSEAPMVTEVSVRAIKNVVSEFDRTDALRNAALPNCNQNCTREPCQTCRSADDHSELSSRSRSLSDHG